ncbi:MAG TPA: FeoA family protein, partial [Terriglobales bacterium]|nr:FeoA family protein [Terriglobales bacterium]
GLKLLSEADPAAAYTIRAVYERDRQLLEFLEERGMRPGAKIKLLARNYDRTLALQTENGKVSVGQPVAERVWVARTR